MVKWLRHPRSKHTSTFSYGRVVQRLEQLESRDGAARARNGVLTASRNPVRRRFDSYHAHY